MVTGDCEFESRPGIILQHDFPTFNIFTHSNLQRQRLENSKTLKKKIQSLYEQIMIIHVPM